MYACMYVYMRKINYILFLYFNLDSCGPGTWILEMSSDYPQTGMFHGIDIAPIFPDTIKPFNATFSIQNALEGLNFPDNHFDYVYMRFLTAAFSTEQWETIVIPELVRVTKNGGYIEIMEWDVKIYGQGPIAKRLMDSCNYQSFIYLFI